jgi:hypothetical protein
MSLDAQLNPLSVPFGTEFPGTVQLLLQLISEYMEITGLEDFNGVNIGSTTPSADNRDKPWFRTNEAGDVLGWYYWDGSEWIIAPTRVLVGTASERDAVADPLDGQVYHVVGTGLYTYVADDTAWEQGFPSAEAQIEYDRHYFFDAHQQLVNSSSSVTTWTQLDLTSYISDAGITSPKAALVRLQTGFTTTNFASGPINYEVNLRVTADNTVSTTANDVTGVRARGVVDDSRAAATGDSFGIIPLLDGDSLYYTNYITGSPPGVESRVWLVGFIY